MIQTKEGYARLEYFTQNVAADSRRKEFDIKNHSLLHAGKKPDFLFIGDSITHYWELYAYFQKPGQLLVNRGIGGDTTTYLSKRFYVDALQLQPKYCIVGIGINDSIELEGDYWKRLAPKPYEEVVRTAKENMEYIISQAEAADTRLILTSLLPVHIPVSLNEGARKEYIRDMNQWLAEICKEKKLIFVNYYKTMTFPGTSKPLEGTTYDGLHPNAKGYEIMAAVLRNTLHEREIEI